MFESGDLFKNLSNFNIMNVENRDSIKNELFFNLIMKSNK